VKKEKLDQSKLKIASRPLSKKDLCKTCEEMKNLLFYRKILFFERLLKFSQFSY